MFTRTRRDYAFSEVVSCHGGRARVPEEYSRHDSVTGTRAEDDRGQEESRNESSRCSSGEGTSKKSSRRKSASAEAKIATRLLDAVARCSSARGIIAALRYVADGTVRGTLTIGFACAFSQRSRRSSISFLSFRLSATPRRSAVITHEVVQRVGIRPSITESIPLFLRKFMCAWFLGIRTFAMDD